MRQWGKKMSKICPKCASVVFKPGPMDEKGEYWGVDRDIHFECDEKGTFISCKGCGEKYRVIRTGRHKEGPYTFQVLGLLDSSAQ